MIVDVIIPALNEEATLPAVLRDIPREVVRHVVVVDNGSTDGTARVAAQRGAVVVSEPRRGYGAACLAGIRHLAALAVPPEAILFLDADYADDPREATQVLGPIVADTADLVIGSRALGQREPGSLTPQQEYGNLLAVTLIRLLFRHRYTDLGPFRAIRFSSLVRIGMVDQNYGWTVEMQVKALQAGLRVTEVPVSHRRRLAGKSKVAGTVRGTLGAGYKILATIFRYAVRP
jgi:glycosyltransferase involved in cell wall biosynthesis